MSAWDGLPGPEWYSREATLMCIGGPADGERHTATGRLGDYVMVAVGKDGVWGDHYRWTSITLRGPTDHYGHTTEFLAHYSLTHTEAENRLMDSLMGKFEEEAREPETPSGLLPPDAFCDFDGNPMDDIPDDLFGGPAGISDKALGHLCHLVSDMVEMGHPRTEAPAELLADLICAVQDPEDYAGAPWYDDGAL